jgi:hypothetical protein
MNPDDIAQLMSISPRRVYQILRENEGISIFVKDKAKVKQAIRLYLGGTRKRDYEFVRNRTFS